jgi:hypothetical protein
MTPKIKIILRSPLTQLTLFLNWDLDDETCGTHVLFPSSKVGIGLDDTNTNTTEPQFAVT